LLNSHGSSTPDKGDDEPIFNTGCDKLSISNDDRVTPNEHRPARETDKPDGSCNVSGNTMKIENIEEITFDDVMPGVIEEDELEVTDARIKEKYERMFGSILNKIDEHQNRELFARFVDLWNELPKHDKKLLLTPMEDIYDDNMFWRQGALESKFRGLSINQHST
jgi:hypothetical protein